MAPHGLPGCLIDHSLIDDTLQPWDLVAVDLPLIALCPNFEVASDSYAFVVNTCCEKVCTMCNFARGMLSSKGITLLIGYIPNKDVASEHFAWMLVCVPVQLQTECNTPNPGG